MEQNMKIYICLFINIFYDLFNDNVEQQYKSTWQTGKYVKVVMA